MIDIIHVEGLNAGYGRHHVLFDLNLHLKEREVSIVVGPNGSGKSTLLRSIFGLTSIYSGSIRLDGQEITRMSPHQIARRGMAYLPQVENIFANLSVRENLSMSSYTLNEGETRERLPEALELFPVLRTYEKRKAGTLSGGERQMLAMAMAIIRRPRAMMFDEPTGNLSPKIAKEVLGKISELRDRFGITVVLVEQNARRALELGDKAFLMVGGKLTFEGHPKDLLAQKELSRLYLGVRQT